MWLAFVYFFVIVRLPQENCTLWQRAPSIPHLRHSVRHSAGFRKPRNLLPSLLFHAGAIRAPLGSAKHAMGVSYEVCLHVSCGMPIMSIGVVK